MKQEAQKSDRELLEAAAKAAGLQLECIAHGTSPVFWIRFDGPHNRRGGDGIVWDPLNDDGDALRLAVKLQMELSIDPRTCWAMADGDMHAGKACETGDDPYAATRRAIVRAAAALSTEGTTP